ncbi:MAG: exosortase/archaeosortase family protein [Candidatus Bathyarchaeia archaeon]
MQITNKTKFIGQHEVAIAAKFLAVAVAVISFYFQDLAIIITDALGDEASYHILAVPFLFIFLLYRKRLLINASLRSGSKRAGSFIIHNFWLIVGLLLVITSVFAYWFGSYTFTPLVYHMLTLPVFTSGLILILFGDQVLKQLFFAVFFLFFLIPPPIEMLYSVGSILSDFSAHASNVLVNAFGVTSIISSQYGSPVITLTRPDQTLMSFSVDVACSGVYSLIGFVIFAFFIAYISRGKIFSKLAVLLAGIPLIIALNIIRISSILTIGYSFGDALAVQIFHSIGATVLMFMGTLILLLTTGKFIKSPKPNICFSCASNYVGNNCFDCGRVISPSKLRLAKGDPIKVGCILIMLILLIGIQAPVFALTEGPAQIITQTASGVQVNTETYPLPKISGYDLSFVYRDNDFELLSHQDASLIYSYEPLNASEPTIWVAVELATTTSSLHRWETCLVNYPLSQGLKPKVNSLDLRDVQIQENPPITARIFGFQYTNSNKTQAVIYWYTTATFSSENGTQAKQVKLSLIAYPQSPGQVEEYEAMLLPVAKTVSGYWEPTRTWTAVALMLSQNGLSLSASTAILLLGLIIYRLFLVHQEKISLKILYNKLSKQKQAIVQAVKSAEVQGNPTTNGVGIELEKIANLKNDGKWLENELVELELVGLIKNVLVNKDDKPFVMWKSNLRVLD